MPKLDEAKERLGLLKFWLGMIIGVFVAIGGWLANHYQSNDIFLLAFAVVIEFFLIIGILLLNSKILKILKEIKNLKK